MENGPSGRMRTLPSVFVTTLTCGFFFEGGNHSYTFKPPDKQTYKPCARPQCLFHRLLPDLEPYFFFFLTATRDVTDSTLVKWDNKLVKCYFYKNSRTVHTRQDFEAFERQVLKSAERDRAGATKDSEIQSIVDRLKARWSYLLEAYDAVWYMWAVAISQLPGPDQAAALERPPPTYMLPHFRTPSEAPAESYRHHLAAAFGICDRTVVGMNSLLERIRNMCARFRDEMDLIYDEANALAAQFNSARAQIFEILLGSPSVSDRDSRRRGYESRCKWTSGTWRTRMRPLGWGDQGRDGRGARESACRRSHGAGRPAT
ncbi:hypothetical protein BC828DRAFT_389735 [Blastocladiella britannica]|nr:hypothetical protein BC828DRAFT_389735 [Blastocladiella britannica]